MATALLIVIYIAFVGLGIPDSLFGTAWPAIYAEFSLPVFYASFVTLIISGGTIVSALFGTKLIKALGTGVVTAVSTALTALALLGFSLSGSFAMLCVFALPLGIGAGAVDTALNDYVANHYKAAHMNFLHCFYGVGVSLSPLLMSFALSDGAAWRSGYSTVFYFQAAIALLVILSLPLWFKARAKNPSPAEEKFSGGPMKAAKIPEVRVAWLVFFSSCAIEYTCGTWGSTFLVGVKGFGADAAARAVTLYYAGLAAGRFLSGVFSGRLKSWALIAIGQWTLVAAPLLLALPLPAEISYAALLLAGLGAGPIFPNLIHLTPQNFGRENSQAVMGTQMAASYVGIMLMPPLFGLAADAVGVWFFPYYLMVLLIVMMAATFFLKRMLKRKNRLTTEEK